MCLGPSSKGTMSALRLYIQLVNVAQEKFQRARPAMKFESPGLRHDLGNDQRANALATVGHLTRIRLHSLFYYLLRLLVPSQPPPSRHPSQQITVEEMKIRTRKRCET